VQNQFEDIRKEPLITRKWNFTVQDSINYPKGILITGANSFIGVHIANELIKNYKGSIHLLVRANDYNSGLEKIANAFDQWHLPSFSAEKYNVHIGDVFKQQFGLGITEFKEINKSVDTVIHLAMNPVYHLPYSYFKDNWLPELEKMISFCGNPENPKTLHYASSFNANFFTTDEDFLSLNLNAWQSGYAGFKWVVNKVLYNAFDKNLTGCIYDIPLVLGSVDKGLCPNNYSIWHILNIFLKTKLYFPFSFRIIPVDVLAQVIIANILSKEPQSFIRPALPEAITEKQFALKARLIGLKKSGMEDVKLIFPGKLRFDFMVPPNFYQLLEKVNSLKEFFPSNFNCNTFPSTKKVFNANLRRYISDKPEIFK